MTSPDKANNRNAQKTTDLCMATGKTKSAANTLTHGILSLDLLLPDDAYQRLALLEQLMTELQMVGTLRQILVERMAVTVWCQRRLVRLDEQAAQFTSIVDFLNTKFWGQVEVYIAHTAQRQANILHAYQQAGIDREAISLPAAPELIAHDQSALDQIFARPYAHSTRRRGFGGNHSSQRPNKRLPKSNRLVSTS